MHRTGVRGGEACARRRLRIAAIALGGWLFSAAGALAGGSLPFSDVLEHARAVPVLAEQLAAMVAQENVDPAELVCDATRLGNQWRHLGGERVLPFECEIGARTVVIEGAIEFLNAKGKVIATVVDGDAKDITKAVFRDAASVRFSDLHLKPE
ncbi:hypothetical protein [Blastochloris sulfoviridis]|uniref:Uncharacterized protein n=1 Tax=Blastochloris sulfoviridis TaxID=50712 RepID=A0A5M6HUJ7_9HYPH|nr:hypothetical protein [Blastochloris sulfoviridis]KAA5599570.1 hypothetical protein F1193_11570 [Blastochloris sulfoviridis]